MADGSWSSSGVGTKPEAFPSFRVEVEEAAGAVRTVEVPGRLDGEQLARFEAAVRPFLADPETK